MNELIVDGFTEDDFILLKEILTTKTVFNYNDLETLQKTHLLIGKIQTLLNAFAV